MKTANSEEPMRKTIDISVLLLGIILFIVACAGAYVALDYRNKRKEHFESTGRESRHIEVVTQEYFDKYISVLHTLSESPCVKEKKGSACDEVLNKLSGRFPGVVNFAALDSEGYFFASGMPFDRANPPSIRKLEFFRELQKGADTHIMNPHLGPVSDVKVSGVIIRLFDLSGDPDGFIGVSIRFSELESLWQKSAETFNHSIVIADRAALIHFASPALIKLIGKRLPEIGLSGLTGSGGMGEVSIDSKRYAAHVRELTYSGLTIIELAPLYTFTGVYAAAHPQVFYLSAALFIAFIVSLVFVWQGRKSAGKLSLAEKESRRMMEMISHSQLALAASKAENNTIEMVNDAFAALYGYSPEELGNRSVSDLFAPESHEELAKALAIIHEKRSHSFESIHLRKDGGRFPAEVYATAIRDKKGKIVNRIVNVQDITRRKQNEEALKQSEEKFNKAFHNSPDAITITKASNGLLMDVNVALLRLSGYAHAEVIGKTSVELDLWASIEDRDRYVSTLREKGRVVDFETDFRTKSGEIRRCLLSGEMYDVGGEKLILGVIRDITERKQAEERILRLTRLYSVLSKINEAIVRTHEPEALYGQVCRVIVEDGLFRMVWIGLVDPETLFLKPVAVFGHEEGYLKEKRIAIDDSLPEGRGPTGRAVREGGYSLCNDIENDPAMAPWRDEALKRGYRSSAAFALKVGDRIVGALNIYSGTPHFFQEKGEELLLLKALSEDVSYAIDALETEHKRRQAEESLRELTSELEGRVRKRTAEYKESQAALLNLVDDLNQKTEELAAANMKLQEFDRLKSMFIASMSHELRTPLNSIIGFTGIILMGMSGEINKVQKKQLGMVKNSANHLLDLINDVIDVSKIETGKTELTIEGFDLSDLAMEVKESFAVAASEKGLNLEWGTDGRVEVTSDRRRVRQILVNLVGNAVKFTETGTVAIAVSRGVKGIEIKVRDTGIGMHREDMESLFQAFSRIHFQDRPVVEGTGLGLYLSRRIAALLGGEITAESEPGRGSEFTLSLPQIYQEVKE
jgi:PAS domain S-box-containing protein